jgi:hypothetical protein
VPVERITGRKERLFEAIAAGAIRHTWYLLMDEQHVVAHPNPSWRHHLYDDATNYDLQTRFNALARMQSETPRRCTRAWRFSVPTGV